MDMLSSLVYILLFVVSIAALVAVISYKEKRVLLAASLGIFAFFAEYIVVSGILFWCEQFTVLLSLGTVTAINVVGLTVLWIKTRAKPFMEMKLSVSRIGVLFILAGFVLTLGKFGYFGMGQDQGVYQVRAIIMMYGTPDRVETFDEYDSLTPQQQAEYREYIYSILGFDANDVTPFASIEDSAPDDISGSYHAIPTYPAMLALWGKMFGMQNMIGVNSLFFIGMLVIMLYLCEKLNTDQVGTTIVMSLMTFSPILIWTAKSSLTEIFLAYIVVMYIFLVVQTDRLYILLSAVPLIAFSFFHITVYTSLPMYMFIYITMYLRTQKKEYITASLIYLAAFVAGLSMMIYVAPAYVKKNTVNPFTRVFGDLVEKYGGLDTLLILLYAMAVFFAVAASLCMKLDRLKDMLHKLLCGDKMHIIYRIFGVVMLLLCVYNLFDLAHVNQSPLVAVTYVTGFIVFPVVLYLVFRHTKKLMDDDAGFIVLTMFMYLILFRAAILAKNVPHYYYYCRYLAPFIVIVALAAGMLITAKRLKQCSAVAAICLTLPLDIVMVVQKDDTKMQWSMITEVCDIMDSDDAVVFGRENLLGHQLLHPIKETTDAAVFPVFECTELNALLEQLDVQYDNVYVICNGEYPDGISGCCEVYSDMIQGCEDEHDVTRATSVFPLPFGFTYRNTPIHIYQYAP